MDDNSLSYKTLKNSSYFFLNFTLPIFLTVFITPVVIKKLGVAEFGIYVLVNTISGFLGLLDFGLSTAVTKFFAEYQARKDDAAVRALLNSVYPIFLVVGLLGFVVFFILGQWFLSFFNITNSSQSHITAVFLLAGLIFLISSLTTMYSLAHSAMQRFDIITKINLVQTFLLNLSLLAVVLLGFKLKAVMSVNLVFILSAFVIYRYSFGRLLPGIKIRLKWSGEEVRKAYKFGVQSSISSMAVNLLVYLDRLIIPVFLGPASLTYYSLPGNVAIKIPGVTNSLSPMLLPMASSLSGSGQEEVIGRVYTRVFRNLTIVAAGLTAAIIIFARKILLYWLGPLFAENGTQVLIILAVTNFFLALYTPLHGYLSGLGKLKFLIYGAASMALINLVLLFVLVPRYGIIGAAWAYLLSILPIILMFLWAEIKFFKIGGLGKYYFKLYGQLLLTSGAFALICKFILLPLTSSFARLAIIGPLAVVSFYLLYYLLGFVEEEDALTFKAFFNKIFKFKNRPV